MVDKMEEVLLERRLLRLLIQSPTARDQLSDSFRQHAWRDMAHRIIYEIVSQSPLLTGEQLRLVLPTRLTNTGIPDFPFEDLYRPSNLSVPEAESLLRELASRHER
jgi:hypothetical protein